MHSFAFEDHPAGGVDPRVARTRRDVLAAAIRVLIEEGWAAVSQPHVARVAGYAKGTVYAHWPERNDLIRDAFAQYATGDMPHHVRTGDLRTDLIGELTSLRTAFVDKRLARALVILAERSSAVPEMVSVRDAFIEEGERPIRELLDAVAAGAASELAALMLCGLVVDSVLLHGTAPADPVIAAAVDVVLRGVGR